MSVCLCDVCLCVYLSVSATLIVRASDEAVAGSPPGWDIIKKPRNLGQLSGLLSFRDR